MQFVSALGVVISGNQELNYRTVQVYMNSNQN